MKPLFVDDYFGEHPTFARLKKLGATPSYAFQITGYEFGNLNGIPLNLDGWIIATAKYNVTFFCDVCGEEAHECEILGHATQVKRDQALALEQQLAHDTPETDRDVIQNAGKHVFFNKFYLFQCPRCGRWVAKGAKHQHCRNDEYGLCRFCGNTMRRLVESNIKIIKEKPAEAVE